MVTLRDAGSRRRSERWINDPRSEFKARVAKRNPRARRPRQSRGRGRGGGGGEPAGGDEPDPPVRDVPRAGWSDLPAEIRLQVYDLVGTRYIMKPVPGSRNPGDLIPAFFGAYASRSGLDGVNSATFEELRAELRKRDVQISTLITAHWECVDQISPLITLIRRAWRADRDWVQDHGDTRTPGRRQVSINLPIYQYLDRRSARPGQSYIELDILEQRTLEEFLETTLLQLHHEAKMRIHILVPRDLSQTHIPANVVGLDGLPVVPNPWNWPDPRLIVSKCQYMMMEAGDLRVTVSPEMEENLPGAEWNMYIITISAVWPVPPLPAYPTTQHPNSYLDRSQVGIPSEIVIINRMRTLTAAAAAAAVPDAVSVFGNADS